MKRLLAACALGSLLFAGVAQARVLVVADVSTDAGCGGGLVADVAQPSRDQVFAMRWLLDRFGADYDVVTPSQVTTQMCRIGVVNRVRKDVSAYAYDSLPGLSRTYDAVIHLAFNGNRASAYTGYRPDSLTLSRTATSRSAPTVPQLMVFNEDCHNGQPNYPDNGTADSTWVEASGLIGAGSGSGNHEGEGSAYVSNNPYLRWFETTYHPHYLKKTGQPPGGMRVLLSGGMNSAFATIEKTGLMTPDPDSVGTANTDTMLVWERLNADIPGAARVVFSLFGTLQAPDSASSAGAALVNTGVVPAWPVLLCAVAHLDSLANGLVLGGRKKPGVGFVLTHGGGRSARNHPGGIFSADTTHLSTSADSIRMAGIPVVIAADPESLAVNAGDIAILKKMGGRFTPFVRTGIDTAAASGNASTTTPRDVWGKHRNRAFYGDSLNHAVAGSDTSLTALLWAARKNLVSLVGENLISRTVVAPDFDHSPKQMRVDQNHGQLDSLMWAIRKARFSTLAVLTLGRDSDPQYRQTTPVGFLVSERRHTIMTTSLKGERVTMLGAATFPVHGSSKFINASVTDTVPPYCDVTCPGPNTAVSYTNRFWSAYFTPVGRDYQFSSYDGFGTDQGVMLDSRDRLYGHKRGSLVVLPMQLLGGGGIDNGYGHGNIATTNPTRTGWLIMKHISNAVKAANYFAGRNIINLQYPEDIEP
jgi:hypothetical protein